MAIVYFGDPLVASPWYEIPLRFVKDVTIADLSERRARLRDMPCAFSDDTVRGGKRVSALEELNFVDSVLADRILAARLTKARGRSRIFISHSSKDKPTAIQISLDLAHCGHRVWLDEWSICVGESITREISRGLRDCNFVAVLLSKHAVESGWVEREWHAKYWEEVQEDRVKVLPILIEDCEVPVLLKSKKYADFRGDRYSRGLEDLAAAIKSLSAKDAKRRRKMGAIRCPSGSSQSRSATSGASTSKGKRSADSRYRH